MRRATCMDTGEVRVRGCGAAFKRGDHDMLLKQTDAAPVLTAARDPLSGSAAYLRAGVDTRTDGVPLNSATADRHSAVRRWGLLSAQRSTTVSRRLYTGVPP